MAAQMKVTLVFAGFPGTSASMHFGSRPKAGSDCSGKDTFGEGKEDGKEVKIRGMSRAS
jgi:hypothetical protein